ncbi:MAG: hypothetical protein WDZ60_10555 [Wenzhouxiangellaceae bacterium]
MSEVKEGGTRKSRGEWIDLVAAYEAADVPQRKFCETHGIPYSSFCYWRKKLSVETSASSTALVELPALFAEHRPVEQSETANSRWRVELELGAGTVLRIR